MMWISGCHLCIEKDWSVIIVHIFHSDVAKGDVSKIFISRFRQNRHPDGEIPINYAHPTGTQNLEGTRQQRLSQNVSSHPLLEVPSP